MYHPYSIDVNRLGVVKNLAMMYAIRNALFKNINFEGFEVVNEKEFPTSPTSLDDLPHATVEYTDLRKMLRLHHLYKNDANKTQGGSLTEVELALAKVLQDVVGKDNKNLETEEVFNIRSTFGDSGPTGIIVPSPIEKIRFRDDNKEAEASQDGEGVRGNTGSKVRYLKVFSEAVGFANSKHPKDTLISTMIRIPSYLIEKSDPKINIQSIANDINNLFAKYEKEINLVLEEFKKSN